MIGRLERVPLREVWMHEAHYFTQWLELNIDVLNDALDLEIVNVDREQAAGKFSIDLVAEDIHGRQLIIENQLEKSDHDHLGKLITYLTAMGAKGAIWIVKDPRSEHLAAVQWLNQALDTDFYMVKVEAVKILDSAPAPLFTLIVGPSREAKEVGQTRKDVAERFAIRNSWWTNLIERSTQRTRLHAHITPGEFSWIGVSAGHPGINYNYTVTQSDRTAELYIDRGGEPRRRTGLSSISFTKAGKKSKPSLERRLLGRRSTGSVRAGSGMPSLMAATEPQRTSGRRCTRVRSMRWSGLRRQ